MKIFQLMSTEKTIFWVTSVQLGAVEINSAIRLVNFWFKAKYESFRLRVILDAVIVYSAI